MQEMSIKVNKSCACVAGFVILYKLCIIYKLNFHILGTYGSVSQSLSIKQAASNSLLNAYSTQY